MICHSCGHEVADDAKFCSSCGTLFLDEVGAAAYREYIQKKEKTVFWLGAVSGMCAFFIPFHLIGFILSMVTKRVVKKYERDVYIVCGKAQIGSGLANLSFKVAGVQVVLFTLVALVYAVVVLAGMYA